MCCDCKTSRRASKKFLLVLILVVAAVAWYRRLSEPQKRFAQNLVRQIPYLPARYAV